MNIFKLSTTTLIFLCLSTTAQAGSFNTQFTETKTTPVSGQTVSQIHTNRRVKEEIKAQTPSSVATHITRSALFYNPAETRTKIWAVKRSTSKTPNLFRH